MRESKVFNGRRYARYGTYWSKAEALSKARGLRRKGWNARATKVEPRVKLSTRWHVWVRRAK